MKNNIGNYAKHAKYWDWSKFDHDRTLEDDYWYNYAKRYGSNVLIPMCAWGSTGAYMAERGMTVTAFDITAEMIAEGKKHYGGIKNLNLFEGDVRNFRFDITSADFCYCVDFGHILTIDDIKKALVCINNHLRDGGGLIIEATLPPKESSSYARQIFMPENQPYPDLKVWKTSEGHLDAEKSRNYISQTFYAEDEKGNVESFEHSFYLQSYTREEWISALKECGFVIKGEYGDREVKSWQSGDGCLIIEAVKAIPGYKKYMPKTNLDHLRNPIYKHGNIALYNDVINLEQPNNGVEQYIKFSINASGEWVGWISVKIGYGIQSYYDGQIGYTIDDENNRNKGYMTDACLALKPFLRKFGYEYITLTVDEKNIASRRVCEKIGAELLEIVDTPTWTGIYRQGQRRTCIYEWCVKDNARQDMNLQHIKIDLEKDKDYILERHCRINYECDCPWATKIPYEEYRANWFSWAGQQEGFLGNITENMKDERTIAEIIKTKSGETIGYLWVYFHAEDEKFIWAEVQDIYVEEIYRKTGLGLYLMEYAEKAAKRNGAKVIRSGTGCKNIKSQGLHQKMGYYQYRFEYEKLLKGEQE